MEIINKRKIITRARKERADGWIASKKNMLLEKVKAINNSEI